MIRPSVRLASVTVLGALSLSLFQAFAQEEQAPAPKPSTTMAMPASALPSATPAATSAAAPVAAPVFPKPNPADFTAVSPTTETVNAFLQASWGYDENRVWQVQAILKTQAEGVSRVVLLVGDKSGKQKPTVAQFYTLPGGNFVIAGNDLIPFGEHPYATDRALLQQSANGPYRGSASKDLEIVEFADLLSSHSKEAQTNMDRLAVDFPKAHIVFESYPLPPRSAAPVATAYGLCVAKQGGSSAFSTFVAAVLDGQQGLATADGATLTLNSAVTKAGLDPAKIATCSATPAVKASMEETVKLARDLNVNQTPMIMVNGRPIPLSGTPYETIKKIIQYQAKLDGVTL